MTICTALTDMYAQARDGMPPYSPGPDPKRGLHDQTRSERCIPSDSNPSRSPTPPPISPRIAASIYHYGDQASPWRYSKQHMLTST